MTRSEKIILGVFIAAILLVCLIYIFDGESCLRLSGAAVDGEAFAYAFAWEDTNGNGRQDANEKPLSGIVAMLVGTNTYCEECFDSEILTTALEYSRAGITNENGGTPVRSDLIAGCACNCWKGYAVQVKVPASYQATTPIFYPLTGDGKTYNFGFMKEP